MALTMLELHQVAEARRRQGHLKNRDDKEEEEMEEFLSFARIDADEETNIHALLKAYAEMIGGDLATGSVPHIEARRSLLALVGASATSDSSSERQWTLRERFEKSKWTSNRLLTASAIQRRRAALLKAPEERDSEQMDAVTDAVFRMGEHNADLRMSVQSVTSQRISTRRTLTEQELVQIMTAAVESRDCERLSFMTKFFRDDTISQLMVRSPTRVLWMNDWYILKELTYAIAVDKEKRRVIVLFRGAKTKQDWSKAMDFELCHLPNPIRDDFAGKPASIDLHSGFWRYLQRKRKDTGTTKYEEICNMADKYGRERIGDDYTLFVTGHSLGAALTTIFSFYASLDPRFVKNGPVQAISFGSPYVGGHYFADCWRYQEECGLLRCARFYNHNDPVSRIPINLGLSRRGSRYRHVGVAVKVISVPRNPMTPWAPKVTYVGREGFWKSYRRAIGSNVFLHAPSSPKTAHTPGELQRRMIEGRMRSPLHPLLDKPLGEIYKELAGMPCRSQNGTSKG